jgi:hypothetical protein
VVVATRGFVFCIPTRWRVTKHSVFRRPASPGHNFNRYIHIHSSNMKSRSPSLKMLQSAVVSIAFLAVLGQGQISTCKLHEHHTYRTSISKLTVPQPQHPSRLRASIRHLQQE